MRDTRLLRNIFLAALALGMIAAAARHFLRNQQNKQGGSPGDMPKFSEIIYIRPDLEALRSSFESLIADLETDKLSVKEAVDRLETCYSLYDDFYTLDTVAELRYYHDVTDLFYADESDWFLEAEPEVDQLFESLCTASANSPKGEELDEKFWGGWTVDAYRGQETAALDPQYLELSKQENQLLAEYRRVMADPTVTWQGQERSYLELQEDTGLTAEAWDRVRDLYYDKYAPILGDIYLRLVGVRQELAAYMGFDSYEDYAYLALYERDYGPDQAQTLTEQIRRELGPLYKELKLQERWDRLSYTELNEEENLAAIRAVAESIGGVTYSAFRDMERYELCDIGVSPKKGNLSYQCYLYSYDNPYVFVKTEGYSDDILSFGHEFGHFVDAWYNHDGTDSNDLAEVFSQGMEYLLLSRIPEDYRQELTEFKLLDTVDTFTQQGSFADFEHRVYSQPAAEWTPEELCELSLELARDYGYLVEGQENYYAKSWFDINHFFDHPFYVVSYCVSNDAAFQLYELECARAGAGLEVWDKMLPRDLQGFLETVTRQGGLEDPFAEGRMAKVAALLREKLSEK